MHKDDYLIFEAFQNNKRVKASKSENAEHMDGITKRKGELAGNIMDIVRYGIPSKEEFIKIRQQLHRKVKEIQDRGTEATEQEKREGHHMLGQIRAYRSQHPDDPGPYAENAESSDERKERVQRGWDINKKRWAKWKMENPEAAAKHAAKKAKSEDAENEPHGYPQGMTAIQNLVLNELKKYGFKLTKVSHEDKERDAYPTVFMKRTHLGLTRVAEIDGMGYINGDPYKEYLGKLKRSAGDDRRPDEDDPYYDTWQSIRQDHAGEDAL